MVHANKQTEGQLLREIVSADEQGQALALLALEEASKNEKSRLKHLKWSTYQGQQVTALAHVQEVIGATLSPAGLAQYHHGLALVQVRDADEIGRIYSELGFRQQIANIQAGQIRNGRREYLTLYSPVSLVLLLLVRKGKWTEALEAALHLPRNLSTKAIFRMAGIEAREEGSTKVAARTITPAITEPVREVKVENLPPTPVALSPIATPSSHQIMSPSLARLASLTDNPYSSAIRHLKQEMESLKEKEAPLLAQLQEIQQQLAELEGVEEEFNQAIQLLGGR